MLEPLIRNLTQDVALLQRKIELDKKAGFNDMARLLEAMATQLFKAVGIADLVSKNQIKVNFPAIDSADDHRDGGIAVQVTSVADVSKIKKTLAAFEKKRDDGKSLRDRYPKLYIFGFCKISKKASNPDYCEVVGPQFFINKLIDLHDEAAVQAVIEAVRRHSDYSSLHPYDDVSCLEIILGYVSRNAVRHFMSCEGSVDAMTRGLREISELIGKGTVGGMRKSKAHHEFEDPEIAEFLRHVLSEIGAITAIVHKANRDGFVFLDDRDMTAIDRRKKSISSRAQEIADQHGIKMSLRMHEVE